MTDTDIRAAALFHAEGGDCTPILAVWVEMLLGPTDPELTRRVQVYVRRRIAEGLQQAKVEA